MQASAFAIKRSDGDSADNCDPVQVGSRPASNLVLQKHSI